MFNDNSLRINQFQIITSANNNRTLYQTFTSCIGKSAKTGSLDHIGPGFLTFLYRKVSETLFTGVCEPETDGRIHPDERSSEGSPSLKTFSTPDERNDIGISCQSIIFRIL